MANRAYTIRVFVPDGDPQGIRVLDRMSWTGRGVFFPRKMWEKARARNELKGPGVYILFGPRPDQTAESDVPIEPKRQLYVGEGDVVDRINLHALDPKKEFWEWAIVFVSTNGSLNKAHVEWLEHKLAKRADDIGACHRVGNRPGEPVLSESEMAEVDAFLNEILQMLPLVGLTEFERPHAINPLVASLHPKAPMPSGAVELDFLEDTLIVPAKTQGFNDVFLGQDCWYAIRISAARLDKIKWIAAYQTAPEKAVTHVAPVKLIEPYGDTGKYKVIFASKAHPIGPIPFGDAPQGSMQGIRYAMLSKLKSAKKLSDVF